MNTEIKRKKVRDKNFTENLLSGGFLFAKALIVCLLIGCTYGFFKAIGSLFQNDHIGRKMVRVAIQVMLIEYRTGAIIGLIAGCFIGVLIVFFWVIGARKKMAVVAGIGGFVVALGVVFAGVKQIFFHMFSNLFPMDYANPGISPETVFRALLVPLSIDRITFGSMWAETTLFLLMLLAPAVITGIVCIIIYRFTARTTSSDHLKITPLNGKWFIPVFVSMVVLAFLAGTNRADIRDVSEPDVILISIDTLRADHVGCYGYNKPTTPNLDLFSKSGIRYDRAISPAPWTLPTHLSVITGQLPITHGVTDFDHKLTKKHLTLAEIFKEKGFATGGFVGHFLLSPAYGFRQGFDKYIMAPESSAAATVDRSLLWIKKGRKRKLFLFVHLFDPHWPYDWHADETEKFISQNESYNVDHPFFYDFVVDALKASTEEIDYWIGRYDGEIYYADKELGRLFEALKKEDRFDNSWIVVFSDHGEGFGDHGFFGHAISCYQETVRVPLIVKPPKGTRFDPIIEHPVALTNLAGLLAQVAGFDLKTEKGTGVLPIESGSNPKIQVSESRIWGGHRYALLRPDLKIWHSPNSWKFGAFSGMKNDELYDLKTDPNEKEDISEKMPGIALQSRKMGDIIFRKFKGSNAPVVGGSDYMRRRLKELGYIE